MNDQPRYSMLIEWSEEDQAYIEWSEEDQAYIVSFPEWEAHGLIGHTHGDTYDEAVKNGQDVLKMLVNSARVQGEQLPPAHTFAESIA